jgi:hypothetical protein
MKKSLVALAAGLLVPVAAAVAVASVSSNSLPVGSVPPVEHEPAPVISSAQARATDAASYAADYGVTQAEALRRLAAQRSLHDQLDRLVESYPDRFAGAWLEHKPEFGAVARFKGAVPEGAAQLAPAVELRGGALRSEAQLEARADAVYEAVAVTFDETLATSYDIKSGTIEVSIATPAELKDLSEAQLRERLPAIARAADVRVAFSDAKVQGLEHHYGGARTWGSDGCTTGFSIYLVGTNTTGLLTAGHCTSYPNGNPSRDYDPPDGSAWSNMYWQDGHRGPWGDFEWHTATTHGEFDDFYTGTNTLRDVAGYENSIYVGDYYCKFGRTTFYGCDNVYRTQVDITDEDGFHIERLVATDDHITDGGDSGGPWFIDNDAVGVHHGYYTSWFQERSLFSPIFNADNALPGIGLLTN